MRSALLESTAQQAQQAAHRLYWMSWVQSFHGPGSSPDTLACSASWTSRRFRYASVSESMHGS